MRQAMFLLYSRSLSGEDRQVCEQLHRHRGPPRVPRLAGEHRERGEGGPCARLDRHGRHVGRWHQAKAGRGGHGALVRQRDSQGIFSSMLEMFSVCFSVNIVTFPRSTKGTLSAFKPLKVLWPQFRV